MNNKELMKLEEKYFKVKLNRLIDEQMILDEECHREVISGLNEVLRDFSQGSLIDFTKKRVIKSILLDIFPEMFFLQPDFGSEIYVCLLSYYDFLYTEQVLTKAEYVEMLLFFQQNMYIFFKKLAKAGENTEADLSEVMEDLFVTDGLNRGPKKTPKNNVIQMPGTSRQKEIDTDFFQFRIDLGGLSPLVWRRVVVPSSITFDVFHQTIQRLFEWQTTSKYFFETVIGGIGIGVKGEVEPSLELKLGEVSLETLKKMTYIYDFGQEWHHKIVLEKVYEEGEIHYPQAIHCLKSVNDAPLEGSRISGKMGHSTLKEINRRLSKLLK